MVITDTIGDMLTYIRNALMVKEELVDIPWSLFKERVVAALVREGFLTKSEVLNKGEQKILRVFLKYRKNKKSAITSLRRVSTPGRRMYVKALRIPYILSGYGVAILSTPKGVLSDVEARSQKVGGEVLCYVW